MSIPDSAIGDYFRLLTDVPLEEIDQMLAAAAHGEVNPRDLKDRLAVQIVTDLHSAAAAEEARAEFDRVFRQHALPDDIAEVEVERETPLITLLVETGLATSRNNARQLINGGGVRLDGNRLTDPDATVVLSGPAVLQAGKRRWLRLIPRG